MTSYLITSYHNPSLNISPAYLSYSEAQHAAECIRAFTGEPCRVMKVIQLWVTP